MPYGSKINGVLVLIERFKSSMNHQLLDSFYYFDSCFIDYEKTGRFFATAFMPWVTIYRGWALAIKIITEQNVFDYRIIV